MPSPCVEVAMDAVGGMSGGQVLNLEGRVVGIVSSSFESDEGGGPTYVTLIWDALPLSIEALWPKDRWPSGDVDLFSAQEAGLAKIVGKVRKEGRDVVMEMESAAFLTLAEGVEREAESQP